MIKRRLLRFGLLVVVVPLATRGADALATRLEASGGGPTTASRSLRTAVRLADRGRGRRR